MSKSKGLTKEQKKRLLQGVKDKGLSEDSVAGHVETSGGECYLTDSVGKTSLIKPQYIEVENLDDLKALAGNADQDYENGTMERHLHENLPDWDMAKSSHAPEALSAEENNNIVKAMKTYVYGHSSHVKSYKDVIHKHHFPMTLMAFSAENITVKSGDTLNVTSDSTPGAVADIGKLTIEEGGSINFEVHATWTVQEFVSE
ncbi:hypothetical protein ACJJIK_04890 [Microbulbifer sp. ZKSA006]|uniref:hypothetical protein n=1 Tax=Microbulbifer sp. ZKSA006 TaxID=3243390 RepID=UPI004039FE23